MVKKKDNSLLIGVIIIAVLIIFIYKSPEIKAQSSQFLEKEKINTNLGSNLGNGGSFGGNVNVQNKENLCDLIGPYVLVFNLQSLCTSNGGIWICNSNEIECSNLNNPLINCSLPVVQTALLQCDSLAKSYCDTKTVSCKY